MISSLSYLPTKYDELILENTMHETRTPLLKANLALPSFGILSFAINDRDLIVQCPKIINDTDGQKPTGQQV